MGGHCVDLRNAAQALGCRICVAAVGSGRIDGTVSPLHPAGRPASVVCALVDGRRISG